MKCLAINQNLTKQMENMIFGHLGTSLCNCLWGLSFCSLPFSLPSYDQKWISEWPKSIRVFTKSGHFVSAKAFLFVTAFRTNFILVYHFRYPHMAENEMPQNQSKPYKTKGNVIFGLLGTSLCNCLWGLSFCSLPFSLPSYDHKWTSEWPKSIRVFTKSGRFVYLPKALVLY